VTRAKQIVILAGTRRAIGMAISNNRTVDRHTALDHRLQQK
jgi:hypothetical protein